MEKSYDTVRISRFSHTGQTQMGPICTPDIGPLLSHGQQCSIVFYKMGLKKMFDVMFNFQHKSDHISNFSHTGQAHVQPRNGPPATQVSGARGGYRCAVETVCFTRYTVISPFVTLKMGHVSMNNEPSPLCPAYSLSA